MDTGDATSARKMRLLRRPELLAGLERTLEDVIARRVGGLDEDARFAIRGDLRRAVEELLKSGGRRVRGISKEEFLRQLERSRDRIVRERDEVEREVEALRRRLEGLREAGGSAAEAGSERRARAAFRESRLAGRVSTELGSEIVAFALGVARGEVEEAGGADRTEIGLLQRRIAKLSTELARMERNLARLVKMKDVDPGVASIYRTVQGLNELDALVGRKQEMLRDIFEANRELRSGLGRTPA